ncbi:hypothetical protein CARUB_v10028171mg [Capsella rubella]|uniref:Uncharacterized protein n=1 Tax=Capsella rubella TaxID=81985 RepID=R0GR77_9BRAS|nr:hypothetical protein CARUB_v10028171mg [Capsella rubella]
MESHHATLGRRTVRIFPLEEIRQKRAAQRLSKASSGPDLSEIPNPADFPVIRKSESGNRLSEDLWMNLVLHIVGGWAHSNSAYCIGLTDMMILLTDVGALYSQLKELQKKNAEMEERNKIFSLKLQTKEVENESLESRLNVLEQNTVPSLRKALKEIAMEKDAAVVLRVKECLKQNVELREVLDKLRTEQAGAFSRVSSEVNANGSHGTETLSLKGELVKEQSRAESLSAQVLQLSAQLQQTTQAYNGLVRV